MLQINLKIDPGKDLSLIAQMKFFSDFLKQQTGARTIRIHQYFRSAVIYFPSKSVK
jgi:hypothetical protein